MITKPKAGEFAAYHEKYLELVPDGELLGLLQDHFAKTFAFFSGIPEGKQNFRYANGKWSIKELLQHLIDVERVFMYRALCFSRNEVTDLPGFDEDQYVAFSNAEERSWKSLLKEYECVRMSTISFFEEITEEMSQRQGRGNQQPTSVRAAGFIIIGHEIHHLRILAERYL
ncbi:MAG: DinB family protein [Chitinophagales bacterium]